MRLVKNIIVVPQVGTTAPVSHVRQTTETRWEHHYIVLYEDGGVFLSATWEALVAEIRRNKEIFMHTWTLFTREANPDVLGYLPNLFEENDPRPAVEQVQARYAYGGGWKDFKGFTHEDGKLCYPGDPPLKPVAMLRLEATNQRGRETVALFECSWLVVFQADGSFRVSRCD